MLPYYSMFVFPVIFTIAYLLYKKEKYRKFACGSFFGALIIILALRSTTVGVDLKGYFDYFTRINSTSWKGLLTVFDIEIGYIILNKIVGSILLDFQFFLFVVALLSVMPIAIVYTREVKLPYLTIVLFINVTVFSMLFSGLRQSIAIALGVIAFYFIKSRKIIPFFVIILLAYTFHSSALILLPMYFIYNAKITKKWLLVIIPILVGVFTFNKLVFNFLLSFSGERYIERYSSLTETSATTMLILFVLFAIFSFVFVDEKKIDAHTIGLRNLLLFSVFLQLFASIHSIAMRMNYYYIILIPLLIPRIIVYGKTNLRGFLQLAHIVMCVFFTMYYFVNAYTGSDILQVYPYAPFWGE